MSDLLSTLSVPEKTILAAFLVIAPPNGAPFTREMIGSHTYAPSKYLTDQFLTLLINKGIITIEEDNSNFHPDNELELTPRSKLSVAIENDQQSFSQLLDELNLKQHASNRSKEVEDLLAKVLIDECIMFLTEISTLDISNHNSIDTLSPDLLEILADRSISETYMLLWRASNDSNPIEERYYYLRGCATTRLERLVRKAYQFHLEYKSTNKKVKPFLRRSRPQTSSITLLLMEELFNLGTSYYEHPTPLLPRRTERDTEHLSDEEKKFLTADAPQWLIKGSQFFT